MAKNAIVSTLWTKGVSGLDSASPYTKKLLQSMKSSSVWGDTVAEVSKTQAEKDALVANLNNYLKGSLDEIPVKGAKGSKAALDVAAQQEARSTIMNSWAHPLRDDYLRVLNVKSVGAAAPKETLSAVRQIAANPEHPLQKGAAAVLAGAKIKPKA